MPRISLASEKIKFKNILWDELYNWYKKYSYIDSSIRGMLKFMEVYGFNCVDLLKVIPKKVFNGQIINNKYSIEDMNKFMKLILEGKILTKVKEIVNEYPRNGINTYNGVFLDIGIVLKTRSFRLN